MIKKFLYIFFIFIFLNNCGFTPQFSKKNISEIQINLINYSGNRDFNIKLNSELSRYSSNNKNSIKNFSINYISQLEKSIISKDSSGDPTEFQLIAKVNFDIQINQKSHTITLSEKFNYKNIDDAFELKNYEGIIVNNLASSISNKLIITLSAKF